MHAEGGVRVLHQGELPAGDFPRELVGDEHGTGVCLVFVDAEPGQGPSLHRHPYVSPRFDTEWLE